MFGAMAIIAASAFATGLYGFIWHSGEQAGRRAAAPPTCDDAISRAAARAPEHLTVMRDGASYSALLKLRREQGVVDVSAHGRTPQEAMARALDLVPR